jgi:hypothetical protein
MNVNIDGRDETGKYGDHHGGGGSGRGGRGRGGHHRGQAVGRGNDQQNMGRAANLSEDDSGMKRQRKKRGGRGRKRRNENQATDRKPEESSDSNNEVYSGGEDVDSDTELYISNIDMQNVKKDIHATDTDLKDLKDLIQSVSEKVNLINDARDGVSGDGGSCKKLNIEDDDLDEVKEAIVGYLSRRGGWVKFTEMKRDPELLHALSPFHIDLEKWLFGNERSFILNQDENDQLLDVAPILSVRICIKYNTQSGCENGNKECGYLHVCKEYIAGTCSKNCQHNPKRIHHLQEGGTRALLTKHKLDKLKANVCSRVIASTLPRICYEYNNGGCDRSLSCPWLHVCEAHFLHGNCPRNPKHCVNHDVRVKRCHKILQRYHQNQLSNNILQHMILPGSPENVIEAAHEKQTSKLEGKSTPKKNETGARPKTKRDYGAESSEPDGTKFANDDKPKKDSDKGHKGRKQSDQRSNAALNAEPEICEPFLRRACKKCSNRHHSLPYLWQYQEHEEWVDFQEEMNIAIEMEFCKVNSGRWNSNITMSTSER